jgi:hypothetical protein
MVTDRRQDDINQGNSDITAIAYRRTSLKNAQKKFGGDVPTADLGFYSNEKLALEASASYLADTATDLAERSLASRIMAEDIIDARIIDGQVEYDSFNAQERDIKEVQREIWKALATLENDRAKAVTAPKIRRGNSGSRKKKKELAEAGVLEQTEQAYLLQNIEKLKVDEQAPRPDQMPRLIIANTRENLLNKLTSSKKLLALMRASPKDISSLTPYIRIAKRDMIAGRERVREFKFSSHSPNLIDYFNNDTTAGREVGLKSFDFETTGKNFFTASRSLQGTMVLFFKSMSDLNPDGVSNDSMPWTELLVNHRFGSRSSDKLVDDAVPHDSIDSVLDELEAQALAKDSPDREAEIFIEIGYNFHSSESTLKKSSDLAKAVDDSKILLSIYPTTTDFNFREDGAVELAISFTAGAEHSSDNSVANVLALGSTELDIEMAEANRKDLVRWKKMIDAADRNQGTLEIGHNRTISKEDLIAKIAALEAEISKNVENERLSNYGKFMEYVYSRGRLYSFTVDEKEYREGLFPGKDQTGRNVAMPINNTAVYELLDATARESLKGKGLETRERKAGERTIAYFYLGDLINYYAWSLVPPDQRIDLRNDRGINQSREIVVGDYIFHIFPSMTGDPTEESVMKTFLDDISTKRINLSKLPVSVSMFSAFMYKNVMKHSTAVYTFDEFLEKAVPELIDNALTAYIKGRKWGDIMQHFTEARFPISKSTVTGYAPGLIANRGGPPGPPASDANVGIFVEGVEEDTSEEADTNAARRDEILARMGPEGAAAQRALGSLVGQGGAPEFTTAGLNLDGIAPDEETTFGNIYEIKSVSIDDIISGAKDPRTFTIIHGSRVPLIGTGVNVEEVGLNELADQAKGIYHLSPGLDAGIVKNISFTQQSSRRKEMELLKTLAANAEPGIGIWKMPYNAEVAIFGNPTFYPGQFVSIHPAVVGVGSLASSRSIAAKLGLGGLYVIMNVKTRLSSGVLESTLSCLFNNHHITEPSA